MPPREKVLVTLTSSAVVILNADFPDVRLQVARIGKSLRFRIQLFFEFGFDKKLDPESQASAHQYSPRMTASCFQIKDLDKMRHRDEIELQMQRSG